MFEFVRLIVAVLFTIYAMKSIDNFFDVLGDR